MLSHVYLGVSEMSRALAFFCAVMDELGYVLKFHQPDEGWAGWMRPGTPRPLFLLGRPYDGRPATSGNGTMVALLAPDRRAVDRAHAAALANGGSDEGAPGPRLQYHPRYYGAYVRDLDGNELYICCHDPAPSGAS